MTIRFIKQCKAPQQRWRTHCSCCGPEMDGWEETTFFIGEECEITPNQSKIKKRRRRRGEWQLPVHKRVAC